jgi:hypothetical protein
LRSGRTDVTPRPRSRDLPGQSLPDPGNRHPVVAFAEEVPPPRIHPGHRFGAATKNPPYGNRPCCLPGHLQVRHCSIVLIPFNECHKPFNRCHHWDIANGSRLSGRPGYNAFSGHYLRNAPGFPVIASSTIPFLPEGSRESPNPGILKPCPIHQVLTTLSDTLFCGEKASGFRE